MGKIDDISLVTKVIVSHDKRAFGSLVMKYQEPIRSFFMGQTLGDKQLSDDLAQDTFVKAYTHISGFRSLSGFSTWLYRIACNVLYDYRRSLKETQDVDVVGVNRASATTNSGLKMDIYEALKMLKADERTCVTLQLMEGLPVDKIAEVTGLLPGTVRSHLSRGKHKLSDYLKSNGYDR